MSNSNDDIQMRYLATFEFLQEVGLRIIESGEGIRGSGLLLGIGARDSLARLKWTIETAENGLDALEARSRAK